MLKLLSQSASPKILELAATLKRDVYDLCLPEGRVVGTKGHENAVRFLTRRLADVGCVPYAGPDFGLPYRGAGENFTNLVGVVPGRDRSLPPLLVGAHYDSVIEAPCADDNGAAVAIALALAGMFRDAGGPGRDVIIALFDAEEPPNFMTGTMGSERFYAEQMDERGVHFALVYDLVGHDVSVPAEMVPGVGGLLAKVPGLGGKDIAIPHLRHLLFMTGAESHPGLPGLVEGAGMPKKLKLMATLNRYVGDMSDHGVFRRNGVPYLFFSCGRWAHYHAETDTPDRLNYRKMARIALLTADLLVRADTEELVRGQPEADTVAFEAKTLKDASGVLYPLLLKWAGVPDLGARENIEAVVGKMLSAGL